MLDEPEPPGFVGTQRPAGVKQFGSGARADQPRQHPRQTQISNGDTEFDEGSHERRVRCANPDVGRRRDPEPAADRRALHGGDHRLRNLPNRQCAGDGIAHCRVDQLHRIPAFDGQVGSGQIHPRAERRPHTGDDDSAAVFAFAEGVHGAGEEAECLCGQRIELVGTVEEDDADTVVAELDLQALEFIRCEHARPRSSPIRDTPMTKLPTPSPLAVSGIRIDPTGPPHTSPLVCTAGPPASSERTVSRGWRVRKSWWSTGNRWSGRRWRCRSRRSPGCRERFLRPPTARTGSR